MAVPDTTKPKHNFASRQVPCSVYSRTLGRALALVRLPARGGARRQVVRAAHAAAAGALSSLQSAAPGQRGTRM